MTRSNDTHHNCKSRALHFFAREEGFCLPRAVMLPCPLSKELSDKAYRNSASPLLVSS